MTKSEAMDLYIKGAIRKGVLVKMLTGPDKIVAIEDAFIDNVRIDELDDPFVVIKVKGREYDAAWIDTIIR